MPSVYTAASMIFKTLAEAGVTHAFVNWGNDHPAFLEELERERREEGKTSVEIVMCPHEIVALSAAQGYAQVTGKPAAVIVHVDVGTQVSIRRRPSLRLASHGDAPYSARRPRLTAEPVYRGRAPMSVEPTVTWLV